MKADLQPLALPIAHDSQRAAWSEVVQDELSDASVCRAWELSLALYVTVPHTDLEIAARPEQYLDQPGDNHESE